MINFFLKKTIIITLLLFAVLPLNAEYLFLKDGLIIKGKIVSETANEVVIRDEKNRILSYPHNKVLRVLYTEISMGKVYVQMKSGENFKGYMIDEDRDSYTFRNDINKPEEFSVKRSKVLFIAERNPSELRGESGYSEISLIWSPPYDKMKFYNVYYKKDTDEKFILAEASWSASYKLKGLKSFSKYVIRVTGVDNGNLETTPSNEVEITTFAKVDVQLKDGKIFKTNLVASDNEKYTFRDDLAKPKDYTVKRSNVIFITERFPTRLKGERGFSDISLSWDLPYENMKYFNIYYKKNKDDKYIIADKAGSNSFKLSGLNGNTKYFIKVTGVDDKGVESAPSNEIEVKTFAIVDVQLKDGKIFKTNLVADDNEKYTFRDDLAKAKDYTVKRADVQYITDRYPTALKGNAGTDRINIEWFKPFDYMTGYKISVKEEGKEYKTFSVQGGNAYTLKDLKSKTKYYIKITGVTKDKTETTQSNEITVTTFARVDVKLKDGKSFKTNLVAEDNEKYIFRDDLAKPKDYTVKRTDVLFITDRIPSGLKGESSDTDIILSWSEPYDNMKYYNIYLKKEKDDKYKIVDTTRSNSCKLKNLTSNTKYFIKVSGVDYNLIGNETPPTNEITVTTLNRAPGKPAGLKVTKIKTGGANVEWKPAVDPDGTISKYKIYKTIKGKKELAGETKETSYKISGTTAIDKVQVSAVDDMGAESDFANWSGVIGKNKMAVSVTPGVFFPVDKFGEMYNTAFGGMVSFSKRDLFFNCFEGGVSLGFYYSFGKDLMDARNRVYGDLMFVPLYVYAGYNFEIVSSFVIKPLISIGMAYLDTKYYDRNKTIAEGRDIHLQIVAASFKVGVAFEYRFTDLITASAGCEYGAIIQNTGLLSFIQVNAGVSFSF